MQGIFAGCGAEERVFPAHAWLRLLEASSERSSAEGGLCKPRPGCKWNTMSSYVDQVLSVVGFSRSAPCLFLCDYALRQSPCLLERSIALKQSPALQDSQRVPLGPW